MKVVVSAIHYPLTMARYFINALKRREDVDLVLVGPFTGSWIPWAYGMQIDNRYVITPDIPLPRESIGQKVPYQFIAKHFADRADVWMDIDAGWRILGRPNADKYIQIQTDPHVLKSQYRDAHRFNRYDLRYCMQTPYIEVGEEYLPYAFDPQIHYPENLEKKYDTCLIGLQYDQRNRLINALGGAGIGCRSGIGIVYDEYRIEYNHSKIALSWSSLLDTPSRVWEAFGMKIPLVSNRVPDLQKFFTEHIHYEGFDDEREAVEKVKMLLRNYDYATQLADKAYNLVKVEHTWDARIEKIFKDCGYGK